MKKNNVLRTIFYSIVFWLISTIFFLVFGRYISISILKIDDFYATILWLLTLIIFPFGFLIFDKNSNFKARIINAVVSFVIFLILTWLAFEFIIIPAAMKSILYGV